MLDLLEGPAIEPVSVVEAKQFLRLEHDEEDGLLAGLILAARQFCENTVRRRLIRQRLRFVADDLYPVQRLPAGPVRQVETVSLITLTGVAQVIPESDYVVSGDRLACLRQWPAPRRPVGGFRVDYEVGYGESAAEVPEGLCHGIKMLVAHWYEHREAMQSLQQQTSLPLGVAALWGPYRPVRL